MSKRVLDESRSPPTIKRLRTAQAAPDNTNATLIERSADRHADCIILGGTQPPTAQSTYPPRVPPTRVPRVDLTSLPGLPGLTDLADVCAKESAASNKQPIPTGQPSLSVRQVEQSAPPLTRAQRFLQARSTCHQQLECARERWAKDECAQPDTLAAVFATQIGHEHIDQALADADLRSTLSELKQLGRVNRLYSLAKRAAIARLPEPLRLRLAGVEWQLLRDRILKRSVEEENLSPLWQDAREWLAARWSVPMLKDPIWAEVAEANFFTLPANARFPLWAQSEWDVSRASGHAHLLRMLSRAPHLVKSFAFDLRHFTPEIGAALQQCGNMRALALRSKSRLSQLNLDWLEKLSSLESLNLGQGLALDMIPAPVSARIDRLTLHIDLEQQPSRALPALPAGLHGLVIAGTLSARNIQAIPQALKSLEIEGSCADMKAILQRASTLQTLRITRNQLPNLTVLANALMDTGCPLRELSITHMPQLMNEQITLLDALKTIPSLRHLSLANLGTKGVLPHVQDLLKTNSSLSSLTLGVHRDIACAIHAQALLDAAKDQRNLRSLRLHFIFPTGQVQKKREDELRQTLNAFWKANTSLTHFAYTVSDIQRESFHWRY